MWLFEELNEDYTQSQLFWLGLVLFGCSIRVLLCIILMLATYLLLVQTCLLCRALRLRWTGRRCPNGNEAIIITGATSGSGLTAATHLYKLGFTIFACYHNDQEPGYAELLEMKLRPFDQAQQRVAPKRDYHQPKLFLIRMDVRSSVSIESCGEEIIQLLTLHNLKLRAIVNNAAVSHEGPFELSSFRSIRNVIDTNLTGSILVSKQFVLEIIKSKGRIVNVCAGNHLRQPNRMFSLLGSSKSAINYFSDSLNEDLRPYGASCCTVVPDSRGPVSSDSVHRRAKLFQDSIGELSDMERATYKQTIDKLSGRMDCLSKGKRGGTGETRAAQIATTNCRIQAFDFRRTGAGEQSSNGLLAGFLGGRFEGADRATRTTSKLDDSAGAAGAFEDAVRLTRTPRRIYAGGWFYALISGPASEYIPPIVGDLLSKDTKR